MPFRCDPACRPQRQLSTGGTVPATFSGPTNHTPERIPQSIAVGNFDGGPGLDLVTANNGSSADLSLFFGDGAGGFGAATSLNPTGYYPHYVAVGQLNLNSDSQTDLAMAASYIQNSIFLGNGSGGFPTESSFTGTGAPSVEVGEFDSPPNSFPDLALRTGPTASQF